MSVPNVPDSMVLPSFVARPFEGARRPARLACLALVLCSCSWAGRGKSVEIPHTTSKVLARVTTSQVDGMRVLWHGPTMGPVPFSNDVDAFVAGNVGQFEDLWRELGRPPPMPEIDFSRFVVFGVAQGDAPCVSEIVAVEVLPQGIVRLDHEGFGGMCEQSLMRMAKIVVVPRRILPPKLILVGASRRHALAFKMPAVPRHRPQPSLAPSKIVTEPQGPALGTVELPARGTLALRELADGTQVWVAHEQDGSVQVLAGNTVDESGMGRRTSWDAEHARFVSEHDARGRSVHGYPAMQAHRFVRIDEQHIRVHEKVTVEQGPVQARQAAPVLVGESTPYEGLAPKSSWAEIADGRVDALAADLVWGGSGPARLCATPKHPKLMDRFVGCPADAPMVQGTPNARQGIVVIMDGPVIVRRQGGQATRVLVDGYYSYRSGVEPLLPPAAKGETRARGVLALGVPATGSSQDARDGFDVPCVPQGGSPDEAFRFAAPHTARYAFELDSEFDGALAVLAATGEVLACNDDRHGLQRSSLVHVALEQGTEVRVIVDGFAGERGPYRLTVSQDVPLENAGVLELGTPVRGDTRGATDDRSEGCYMPAGDDEWTFSIDDSGTYRFTVESKSFAPALSILEAGTMRMRGCGFGRHEYELSAGDWTVVVDGAQEGHEGAYTLQVQRGERTRPCPAPWIRSRSGCSRVRGRGP